MAASQIAVVDLPNVDTTEAPDAVNPPSTITAISAIGRQVERKTSLGQLSLAGLAVVGFLFFARPVMLPIVLACVGAMTLKPVIRWFGYCRIRPAFAAGILLSILISVCGVAFFQLGRPAVAWMNGAPQHMLELRHKVQKMFPRIARFSEAATAVHDLGATQPEGGKVATVELKTSNVPTTFINWTGAFLASLGETLVLLYLLLASGDMFLQKLVHVMPTFADKKRAVEISREIQENISNYLFSVSAINIALGAVASGGLYFLGVSNAGMWGMLVALLNFVPYFGPVSGMALLASVGLLTFETLWQAALPAVWYLLLHLVESNLVTPVLLGRRFTLNPVVIFISLIFWTWLWGVPGALLSVPILVSIKAVSDRVAGLSSLSEVLTS
jgi:predicted PurR-regulated permease PerM